MSEASENAALSAEEKDKVLLGYLRMKYGEGLGVLKKERAWEQTPQSIAYIEGKQPKGKGKALSQITDNRLRKLAMEVAATMTDVRPIWNYETYAEQFKKQGDTLNKLARAWWRNNRIDKKLVSIILYALCGGTGYGLVTYSKVLAGGEGDLD